MAVGMKTFTDQGVNKCSGFCFIAQELEVGLKDFLKADSYDLRTTRPPTLDRKKTALNSTKCSGQLMIFLTSVYYCAACKGR